MNNKSILINNKFKKVCNIFFDLDGTLIDNLIDITTALNQIRQHFKLIPMDKKKIAEFIGLGFPSIMKKVLHDLGQNTPKEEIDQALKLNREFYTQNLGKNTLVYPGVIETLTRLKKQGIKLAIVTNAGEYNAVKLLTKLNLLDFFQVVIGGDTTSFYKPEPWPLQYAMEQLAASKNDSVMVGDSEIDYMCSQAAGVPFAFVTYGYHYGFDFNKYRMYAVINKFDRLFDSINI